VSAIRVDQPSVFRVRYPTLPKGRTGVRQITETALNRLTRELNGCRRTLRQRYDSGKAGHLDEIVVKSAALETILSQEDDVSEGVTVWLPEIVGPGAQPLND